MCSGLIFIHSVQFTRSIIIKFFNINLIDSSLINSRIISIYNNVMILPFVVYELHAGIELIEGEAVLDSNPIRSCKLNVQRNSALNGKISRRNRG